MNYPLVSIVIPTYNRKDNILRMLDSIYSAAYPKEAIEVIIVDNASDLALQKLLKNRFTSVVMLNPGKNLFSNGARRLGAETATGDYIFLLDDDNTLEKDCLIELVKAMEDNKDLGVVGPVMLNGDSNVIWCAGAKLSTLGNPKYFYGGVRLQDASFPDIIEGVEYFPNACLVRRTALKKVPLDDRIFPHNWAETDFCFRIIAAGYKIAGIPSAIEHHHIGYTGRLTRLGPEKTYDQSKSRILFRRRHLPHLRDWLKFWMIIFPISSLFYAWNIVRVSEDKSKTLQAYFIGTLDGIKQSNISLPNADGSIAER